MAEQKTKLSYRCLADENRFTLRILSECSGVNRAVIGNWLLRDGWQFPTKGVGKDRKYGVWDLVMCVIVRELVAIGVNGKPASRSIEMAQAAFGFTKNSILACGTIKVPQLAIVRTIDGKIDAIPAKRLDLSIPSVVLPLEEKLLFAVDELEIALYSPLRQNVQNRKIAV